MKTYVTWDKSRQRWIFQISVPDYARHAYDGRTLIKKSLGKIAREEAETIASNLANEYKRQFAKYKPRKISKPRKQLLPQRTEHLVLDADNGSRLIETWKRDQAERFKRLLREQQQDTSADWHDLESKLEGEISIAKDKFRRHDASQLTTSIKEVQTALNISFTNSGSDLDTLVDDFNAQKVCFLQDCLAVALVEKSVNVLFPSPEQLLPLVDLWGNTASHLVDRWEHTVQSNGGNVDVKTRQTYAAICRDVANILGRRPVEAMTPIDIDALRIRWIKNNCETTIRKKLGILKSLLCPLLSKENLKLLFTSMSYGTPQFEAAREPFSDGQLLTFYQALRKMPSIREEDMMLPPFLLLMGSHIEELYKLTANDFEPIQGGWLVRFADHRQTGNGDMKLKNPALTRRLPLLTGVFPELDAWLQTRIDNGGYIFPSDCKNKLGIRSAYASKRLNAIIHNLFPHDRRLVLQSTRNTAAIILRQANIDPRLRRRFLGHKDIDVHDQHYEPGSLIDGEELKHVSKAIAVHLRRVLRLDNVVRLQARVQVDSICSEYRFDVPQITIHSAHYQPRFNFQQSQIQASAHVNFKTPTD